MHKVNCITAPELAMECSYPFLFSLDIHHLGHPLTMTLLLMVLCERSAPVSSRALLPTRKCSAHNRAQCIYLPYPSCGVYSLFSFYDALDFCNVVLRSLLFVPYGHLQF